MRIETERYGSHADYWAVRNARPERWALRTRIEAALGAYRSMAPFGFVCPVDGHWVTLAPDPNDAASGNWREGLSCPRCRLIARLRFCLATLYADLPTDARIYLTEQATFAYQVTKRRYRHTIGSEYVLDPDRRAALDGFLQTLTGDPDERLRCEDVTALTLPSASIDAIGCFEVLEHVPDYPRALAELARVLRPGGTLLITVPFRLDRESTLVRARQAADGRVEHIEPPEYHGDPVSGGVLCFYHFGWDLLDRLRALGFVAVELLDAWSPALGLLGDLTAIRARRPPP